LFVASKGVQDAIWKYADGVVTELWTATGARLAGAPALSPDQRTIAFTVQGETRGTLYLLGIDGGEARTLSDSLDVRGSPAWAPQGAKIAVAAVADGVPRLFVVPLDGGPPVRIVDDHAVDPSWSPDGRFVVYSVAEVGPRFAVKAVTPDGQPWQLPPITLSRGARRLQVVDGGAALVALRGEIGRGDLVLIDLGTGAERRLTSLGDQFVVRDFDVSADGRDLVVDRYVDDTDLVLVDRG
jgi:Tol biopolymer transport system component